MDILKVIKMPHLTLRIVLTFQNVFHYNIMHVHIIIHIAMAGRVYTILLYTRSIPVHYKYVHVQVVHRHRNQDTRIIIYIFIVN